MKLFFDLEGFVFVVGLDQRVVEWLIDARYQRPAPTLNADESGEQQPSSYQVRGADYIQKIFQVPFTLAPVAVRQLPSFLRAMEDEAKLPHEQRQELRSRVEPHLRYLVTESGVNPREVKRYINAYILTLKVKPNLDPDTVLALQTVTFRHDWRSVRTALYAWREVFIDALGRQVDGDDVDALPNLDSQLSAVPESFLAYVATGAPGNSLLTTTQLDEYIYTGEAARSTQDLGLLESFRQLAKVKQKVRDLEFSSAAGGRFITSKAIPEIQSLLEPITITVDSHAKGPVAHMILGDLQRLHERLPRVPEDANSFEDWREEQAILLDKVQRNLMALYDLSSLS
jgi:hypothetical protein